MRTQLQLGASIAVAAILCSCRPQSTSGESSADSGEVDQQLASESTAKLVSDFEGTMGSSMGFQWRAIDDKGAGGVSTAKATLDPGGAEGTRQAIRVSGMVKVESFPFPFAGLGLPLGPVGKDRNIGTSDLSGYRGIQFWVKGNGKHYMLRIESNLVSDFNLHHYPFEAGREWTLVRVPFSELKQWEWGGRVPWKKAAREVRWIQLINFSAPGEQFNDLDFTVDQVALW